MWRLQLLLLLLLLLERGKSDGGEKDQPHCEPACVTSYRIKVHCKRLLEPRSHLCILFHWGRQSVYSNVRCWIQYLSLIFILYFISLSVITSPLFTYITNLEPIFEYCFPIPSHYWSYISIFLVSIKFIFFFTLPIIIWWKYLCVFKVWLLVSDLMLKGRWFSLTQNLGHDR